MIASVTNNPVVSYQECCLSRCVRDAYQAVYDFATRVIRSIAECFSSCFNRLTLQGRDLQPQTTSPLFGFYRNQQPNNNGVTLDQILSWGDDRLESVHNYIQWLFPLYESSPYNPTAPTLDDASIRAFQSDTVVKNQVLRSFRRMLSFYGLQMDEATKVISRAPNFPIRSRVWLLPGNHNHLRITRIIRSMDLLGLSEYSAAFSEGVADIASREGRRIVSPATLHYWHRAASRLG